MLKVYEGTAKEFVTNGLGTINPLSCIETKKLGLNGWYLTIEVDKRYADLIVKDRIIVADTKEYGAQPFRIGNPTIENRRIRFVAKHVIFDSEHYILSDVRPTNLGPIQFVKWLNDGVNPETPYTVSGTASGEVQTAYYVRRTFLDALSDVQQRFNVIIDPYNFQIRVFNPEDVGSDNGFTVLYGKNIQGIQISENWDDVCTKVLPVGTNGLLLPELYIAADIEYPKPYTKVISFDTMTEDDNRQPIPEADQQSELRAKANAYLEEHKYPKVSYKVTSDVPQSLKINDVVHIRHPFVTVDANVIEYSYDTESKRVKALVFGNYDDSPANQLLEVIKSNTKSISEETVEKVVDGRISGYDQGMQTLITMMANGLGMYHTAELSSNGGYVHYLHDQPRKEDSSIIFTVNSGGLAISTDGGQTYNAGIDSDGNVVANILSAIGISADWIKVGIISDALNKNFWNLETGEFSLNGNAQIGGQTAAQIAAAAASAELTYFVNNVYLNDVDYLQDQLDGNIMTYFYDYLPTLNNVPASQWLTDETKKDHYGDLFYDRSTGKAYRFNYVESGGSYTFSWDEIGSNSIINALVSAAVAQDTADNKRRVFTNTPTVPYDVGDLWCVGATGDILTCTNAKTAAQAYAASDWSKLNKYIDQASADQAAAAVLSDFVSTIYNADLESMQDQLDGKVDTYFYAYVPTLTNVPASNWTTETARNEHVGDLFYNTATGYAYRFKSSETDGNVSFAWERIGDNSIISVLAAAAAAQDTADNKRRVFITQPVPPYDIGDVWFEGASGDIKTCITAKASGSFSASHWSKLNKYIDQAAANQAAEDAVNAQTQEDIFNRLTNNGTIQGVYMSNGQLYINGAYIKANSIAASSLSVTELSAIGATIGGFAIDSNSIHTANSASSDVSDSAVWLSSSVFTRSIGGTSRSNLKFAIGGSFAVDKTGTLYASNAVLSGRLDTGGSNGTYANLYNGTLRGGGKDRNSDSIVEYGYISFPGGQYDSNDNVHNTVFLMGKDSLVFKGHIFTNAQYDVAGNRHCLNGWVKLPTGTIFHYDNYDKLQPQAGTDVGNGGIYMHFQNGMLVLVTAVVGESHFASGLLKSDSVA